MLTPKQPTQSTLQPTHQPNKPNTLGDTALDTYYHCHRHHHHRHYHHFTTSSIAIATATIIVTIITIAPSITTTPATTDLVEAAGALRVSGVPAVVALTLAAGWAAKLRRLGEAPCRTGVQRCSKKGLV